MNSMRIVLQNVVTRQERNQMFGYPDRAHSWSSSSMWYGKGFVKVKVANVCSYTGRVCKPNLCIHICTIHINLSAVLMYYLGYLRYGFFEHSVCRRVGNHKAGKVV